MTETVAPSVLEVAAPFLITAGVSALGGLGALLVVARMRSAYAKVVADARLPARSRIIAMKPESLAAMSNWAIDGAALMGTLLGPGIGLVLLAADLRTAALLLYTLVMLVAVGGFFLFVDRVPVEGYPNRPLRLRPLPLSLPRVGPFTPIVVLAVVVNLFAAVAILLLGS